MDSLELLRANPLLSQLIEAELGRLRRRAVTKRWKKDEVIFRKGDTCNLQQRDRQSFRFRPHRALVVTAAKRDAVSIGEGLGAERVALWRAIVGRYGTW